MTIKKKSKHLKEEYVYKSPDEDVYNICVIETDDRRYVEIARGDSDPSVYDAEMVKDIYKILFPNERSRSVLSAPSGRPTLTGAPVVTDHRREQVSDQRPESIEKAVASSMEKLDDDVKPVEALEAPVGNKEPEKPKEQESKKENTKETKKEEKAPDVTEMI